jgi:hypothetical protein
MVDAHHQPDSLFYLQAQGGLDANPILKSMSAVFGFCSFGTFWVEPLPPLISPFGPYFSCNPQLCHILLVTMVPKLH